MELGSRSGPYAALLAAYLHRKVESSEDDNPSSEGAVSAAMQSNLRSLSGPKLLQASPFCLSCQMLPGDEGPC